MNHSPLPIACVLFAFLLALTGCAVSTPTPNGGEPTPANAGSAGTFTTGAFAISYPEGWAAKPCEGPSVPVVHAGDLGAEALACFSASEAGSASCIVSFKGAGDPAEIDAAYVQIYREGSANHYWRVSSMQPVTIDGRASREVIFKKPHGEPYYAMRDVWVPAEGGAYIVTCLTYASSFRQVNGKQVALEDLYAPAFESITRSFHIKGEAAPPAQATVTVGATAEPTAPATAEGTAEPTPGKVTEEMPDVPACRFVASASGQAAGWYWLRDEAYRDRGLWECTGLPVGAPLPITLAALVTNRADGGSGYSAPVRVIAGHPAGGPEWSAQVYLQNPVPVQNPENSHGAGYPTTGYFMLPADYVGAGGTLLLQVERLSPYHVAVNGESLHFDRATTGRRFHDGGTCHCRLDLAAGSSPYRLRGMALFRAAARAAGRPGARSSGDGWGQWRGGVQRTSDVGDFRDHGRCRPSGDGGPGAEPAVRGSAGRLRRAGLPGLRFAGGRPPASGLAG